MSTFIGYFRIANGRLNVRVVVSISCDCDLSGAQFVPIEIMLHPLVNEQVHRILDVSSSVYAYIAPLIPGRILR